MYPVGRRAGTPGKAIPQSPHLGAEAFFWMCKTASLPPLNHGQKWVLISIRSTNDQRKWHTRSLDDSGLVGLGVVRQSTAISNSLHFYIFFFQVFFGLDLWFASLVEGAKETIFWISKRWCRSRVSCRIASNLTRAMTQHWGSRGMCRFVWHVIPVAPKFKLFAFSNESIMSSIEDIFMYMSTGSHSRLKAFLCQIGLDPNSSKAAHQIN
jgi:hypothetical protein